VRAIFFGTPQLAVPSLDALVGMADVVRVVCQPDRPAGRGMKLRPPPVKERALELGLEVVQPTKVRTPEFAESLRALEADVAVVIAYGRILPRAVLDAPRRGCVNVHASILPRWRGAGPIQWSIVSGDAETGVCLMQMDEGMDTGPVFTIARVPIGENTTAGELSLELAACAAGVVRASLAKAVSGELVAEAQDHARATHARLLEKSDGRVDFTKRAKAVHDHVRGMTPWPGASTTIDDGKTTKTLKLLETRLGAESTEAAPGTVVHASGDRIEIACGTGTITLLRAQIEGRKALGARELVSGRAIAAGQLLGGG
jgi:methionyl-tRNA formyltransferase